MADYITMTEAIDAGLTNMAALHAHARNDDSTRNYETGMDWFFYNSKPVTKIYSSGNSWLGFGASAEQMKVNRRDAAVWDEYTETGKIASQRFFKFTWKGTSHYSGSYEKNDSYQQYFDVFLIEDGRIFLNFNRVPTSNCNGTNALVCGSETVAFTVAAGEACEYTFTPADPATGTGWTVEQGRPNIGAYVASGEAVFELADLHNITNVNWSEITWVGQEPEGTTLTLYEKVDDGEYTRLENGGELLPVGTSLEDSTLYLKVELTTEDTRISPSLSYVHIAIRDVENLTTLIIKLPLGNPHSIQNAIGDCTLVYDGSGGLIGLGGSVGTFEFPFLPEGLEVKPHQNDVEHLEITEVAGNGIWTTLIYTDIRSGDERIEVSDIIGSGVRIYVGDL